MVDINFYENDLKTVPSFLFSQVINWRHIERDTKNMSFEVMCDLKAYDLSKAGLFCVHLDLKQFFSSLPSCSN